MKKYLIILILLFILPFTVLADSYLNGSVVGSETTTLKTFLNIDDTISVINFESVDNINITGIDLSKDGDNSVIANVDYDNDLLTIQFKGKLVMPQNLMAFFYDLKALEYVNGLEYLDTSNVTSLFGIFLGCSSLKEIDLSAWDTSLVTTMRSLFSGCENLTTVNMSNLNVSSLSNTDSLFYGCEKLKYLDISNWVAPNLTIINQTFIGCSSLEKIDISGWDISIVTSANSMFAGCTSLKVILVGNKWDMSNVDSSTDMFYNCVLLRNYNENFVDKTNANTSDSGYLTYKTVLKSLYVEFTNSSNDTSKSIVSDATRIEFTNGIISDQYFVCNVDTNDDGSIKLYKKDNEIYIWSENKIYFPYDSGSMFRNIKNVKEILFNNMIDISTTNSLARLFYQCLALERVDISSFGENKVTNLNEMFYDCKALKDIDLTGFYTGNVTRMNQMFFGCKSLENINISNIDTSKVESMLNLFSDCSSLKYLDLSNIDTSSLTNIQGLVGSCTSLKNINFINFDTSKIENMQAMFVNCSELESIDLSSFNTTNVTNMSQMFALCNKLKYIYVGENWNTDLVTNSSNMFYGATLLRNYNENVLDKTNANTSDTGYLTLAPTVTIKSDSNLFGNILKISKNVFSNVKELFSSNNDWDHNDNDIINTGETISIMSGDNIFKTYIISYNGDTNGDGKINYIDYVRVYNHINNKKKLLSNEYLISADYNNDNTVDNNDYSKIYSDIKK